MFSQSIYKNNFHISIMDLNPSITTGSLGAGSCCNWTKCFKWKCLLISFYYIRKVTESFRINISDFRNVTETFRIKEYSHRNLTESFRIKEYSLRNVTESFRINIYDFCNVTETFRINTSDFRNVTETIRINISDFRNFTVSKNRLKIHFAKRMLSLRTKKAPKMH